MSRKSIKFIQENLHHAKAASAILSKIFIKGNLDVALLQEPWTYNSRIQGMPTKSCKLIYDNSQIAPRAAILVNTNANVIPITEFINRDIAAVSLEVPTTKGKTVLYVASAYFPSDVEDVPPPEVAAFVTYCRNQNRAFIIGCDANAHHTIWSSSGINKRGESLFDFISKYDIDICNRGNSPTFVNAVREEVLDLTLCSSILSDIVVNWHVSDEISLSDHRQILFEISANGIIKETYRDFRKTNWDLYISNMKSQCEPISENIDTIPKLENGANYLITKINEAYNVSCPLKQRSTSRDVSWWNDRLGKLRKKARKLFNRAKTTSNWSVYREALSEYNKEIRRSKRKDWRHMCENIESAPATARLQKVLSKDHSNGLGTLKKTNGQFTKNAKESLELLMHSHFPGSLLLTDQVQDTNSIQSATLERGIQYEHTTRLEGINEDSIFLTNLIFSYPRIEWAIDSFSPFKSPGPDGIFPALFQKCKSVIIPFLIKLFRSSFLLGYIPKKWRNVRAIFIPKANKKDKSSPKSFRPISLSSIFLKLMEKLIDEYIKSEILINNPLSKEQFAYQAGKSTITALHTLTTKIEKSFSAKEILLASFLDIEGAFDNASFVSMRNAMRNRGFNETIVYWIVEMLSNREISANLGNTEVKVTAVKGCPQGGVLSPLLWSLVVDDLLGKLKNKGFEIIGFADDIVIIVRGKYDNIVFNRMQCALNFTLSWCKREGLNINPTKTTIIPFTKRRKVSTTDLKLGDVKLSLSLDVNYLGVTLDNHLSWNKHIEKQTNKAINAFWVCKRTFGKKWGLKPKMIHWIYSAIVKPRIIYASLVWWPKTKQQTAQIKLNKLQRLAITSITGAMSSTPSKALEALLNLLPLHQFIQLDAVKAALRLKRSMKFLDGDLTGHLSILREFSISPLILTNEDYMLKRNYFDHKFRVLDFTRSVWDAREPDFRSGSLVFYTDGSRQDNRVGAGVTGPGINLSVSMGKHPTVFQAEIYAIIECASICLKRNYKNANICICSDSQAALNAVKSKTYTSKLVWECILLLQKLSCRNMVNLYWVPGHCGIKGNEIADQLAKKGSSMQFIGPEPFFGLSACALKGELMNWEKTKVLSNWNTTSLARQSKRFIKPNALQTQKILNLTKSDLRIYTGLITGHCPSKYHLKLIGKRNEDSCRFCKLVSESSEHLLCDCVALFHKRRRYLDKGLTEPHDIWSAAPNQVVNFIRNVSPDWDKCLQ